jgi:hypothetical protein
MKTKNQISLTKKAIPDGEGFIALPIVFNRVIAGRSGATIKQSFASCEIAHLRQAQMSSQSTLLAMTKI